MRRLPVHVVMLLVMLPLVADASAEMATIEGRVVDGSGSALPGVTVTLTTVDRAGLTRKLPTSAEGRCRFHGLPPGEYRVAAELDGSRVTQVVRLRGGGTVRVKLTLHERHQRQDSSSALRPCSRGGLTVRRVVAFSAPELISTV
ncbi:MAG TPA: carboxypeptidase-like regulatory domain-containing protein [Vicinamibacteria bacterium]|nr:carboxypeptidase-like regulatory domain-containing protein [Vicinamibacteria bacterium]